MRNSLVDLTNGKIPAGLVELYGHVATTAAALDIRFFVVGALARDLVLVHGYGATTERGTKDVDFGIDVANWEDFNALADGLGASGFRRDPRQLHKLHFMESAQLPWEIDIVPFGAIAGDDNTVSWPPEGAIEMSVLGFDEALAHAITVKIAANPDVLVPVASPAGVALLKLIAWLDRERQKRAKDAQDLEYLMRTYEKIPEINTALFEEGFMEAHDWEQDLASAAKLGHDVGLVASAESSEKLQDRLIKNHQATAELAREMRAGRGHDPLTQPMLWAFLRAFQQAAQA